MNTQSGIERSPEECVADRLKVLSVTCAADIFYIARGDGEAGASQSDYEDLAAYGHQLEPLKFISDHLAKIGCKTVIVQHPVVDKDYQAEFQAFYSTTFKNYSRYSTRLHFFSQPLLEEGTALEFVDAAYRVAESESGYSQTPGYLGYMNIRPVSSCPVGRTVLLPPQECKFLTVKDSFRSTLAGKDFWVVGTPFMQQDSSVAACAQVALWMALRVTKKKDGKEDKTVAEISEAATKELVFGRILPTAGLGLQNIQAALEKFGYHGQLLNFRSNSEPDRRKHVDRIKNDLYPYLESGIPIIALCDGENSEFSHAVVVVGHGWNKRGETHEHTSRKIQLNQGQSIDIHSPVVWIDDLYINNDNRGPYQQWKDNSGDYKIENIKAAMPLLPKDVYMSAAEAQVAAERALSDAFNGLLAAKRLEGKLTLQDIDHKFVMRSYLTSRHEFRIWASQHQSTSMSRYYRQKHLPEKLWVFEINLLQGYYKTDEVAASGDQRRVGELIIDPTGDPHDFPLLAMHLNLMCIANEPTGLLVNVDPEPLKIDMIFLDETVKNYPLHIPYQRLRSAT